MQRSKSEHDVRGRKINCVNYQKCPLCYGCRKYSSIDPECQICLLENKKANICNINLHRDEVTAKMITKNNIIIMDELKF